MLNFRSLVLLTTNLCNLKCRHCYPSSGASFEEVYHYGQNKMMTAKQAENYIKQIPFLDNVINHLHLGGGESTLFQDEFKKIVSCGNQYGLSVSMVTNCWWAKDQEKADHFIEELHQRGMIQVQISLSMFHQEFLEIKHAIYAIRACKKFGLTAILRPVITKTATLAKTLEQIPQEDLKDVMVYYAKCMPVGRAGTEIPQDEFLCGDLNYGGCHTYLNLTIRQDGSVYPCCAGSDITKSLCLGNANTEPLRDIIGRAELDPLLITLTHYGTKYLAEMLRESGGKDFLKNQYVNICHLCSDLFVNDETAEQIRHALNERLRKREPTELEGTPLPVADTENSIFVVD